MILLHGVLTMCSLIGLSPTPEESIDTSSDTLSSNEGLWTFCKYNELSEEIRQRSSSCVICLEPLTNPGLYGYTNVAICYRSANHMFHASCLLRTAFKTNIARCCPLCRCPLRQIGFHDDFFQLIYKAAEGSDTIVECESAIYKYVLHEGTLLHISNFNYSRLFILERILLLAILKHIECTERDAEEQAYGSAMTPKFAQDMISDIMSYESDTKVLPNCMRKISDDVLSQLNISLDKPVLKKRLKTVLSHISRKRNVVGNFNFLILSNLVHLVMKSTLSGEKISRRLIKLLSAYSKSNNLKLNEAYSLVHLFATRLPNYECFIKELGKHKVMGHFFGTETFSYKLSDILPQVGRYVFEKKDEWLRCLVEDI